MEQSSNTLGCSFFVSSIRARIIRTRKKLPQLFAWEANHGPLKRA